MSEFWGSLQNRYKAPEFWDNYIDIHLGVGEWDNVKWSAANRIQLVEYNINGGKEINNQDVFIERGDVEWKISSARRKNVSTTYNAEGCRPFSKNLQIPAEYKYFKLFAWADHIDFEINCKILIRKLGQQKTNSKLSSATKNKNEVFVEADPQVSITNRLNPVIEVKELAQVTGDLLELLRDPTGNMVAIFGKWGRGKTYLWNQIWEYLKDKSNTSDMIFIDRVEFHAWKYQDTPASWAYLYETLADKYFEENRLTKHKAVWQQKKKIKYRIFIPFERLSNKVIELSLYITEKISKYFKRFKLNLKRKGYTRIRLFFLEIILFFIWIFLIPDRLKISWVVYLFYTLGVVGIVELIHFYLSYKPKAINILKMYSEKISFQKYLGLQAEIQKEIIFLLKTWISNKYVLKRKILLFVDDIDRCSEDKIIQVVDSLKVMLEDQDIANRITILAALDERVLKMAINVKYYDLVSKNSLKVSTTNDSLDNNSKTYLDRLTKEYIDKLFILGVKLGELSPKEKERIFDSITENKISDNESKESEYVKKLMSSASTSLTATTTLPLIENLTDQDQNEMFIENEGKEINRFEYNFLKTSLSSFVEATPRTIRIYYYRYLLAKKIMKYKFKNIPHLSSQWRHLNTKRIILPLLIIHYSLVLDSSEIGTELESLENITTKKIKRTVLKTPITIDVDLYTEILKIVEMVVPY